VNDDARVALESKMKRFKRMVLGQEQEMRRAGSVVVRPRLNDPCIVKLRPLLMEEKKAECLLAICTSIYIIKALRPLIKGRRGKGTISLCGGILFYSIFRLTRFLFSFLNK
jgi:hypothetical protein